MKHANIIESIQIIQIPAFIILTTSTSLHVSYAETPIQGILVIHVVALQKSRCTTSNCSTTSCSTAAL
jgi:hypothetical protein